MNSINIIPCLHVVLQREPPKRHVALMVMFSVPFGPSQFCSTVLYNGSTDAFIDLNIMCTCCFSVHMKSFLFLYDNI